jgi:hypothetical protein
MVSGLTKVCGVGRGQEETENENNQVEIDYIHHL